MLALLVVACAGTSPLGSSPTGTATAQPAPTAAATATPTAPPPTPTSPPIPTPTAAPTPPPIAGAATVSCPTVPSPSSLLVLGKLSGGSDEYVIRDITDLNNARTDCSFQNAGSPKFVSATRVAYSTLNNNPPTEGRVLVADLTNGSSVQVLKYPSGSFGSGAYAFSADGAAVTYTTSDGTSLAWHLLKAGADQVLAAYPAVPGRGINPDDDDFFIGFSPDGRFVALVQTFTKGTGSDTMPLEVRSVADGSVAFAVDDATMATWGGTGSTLVYRTRAGAAYKWPGMFPLQISPSLKWIRPRPSPDGRFIIYTLRDAGGLGHVHTLDLATNATHLVSAEGRSSPAFLTSTLVFYQGERLCTATEECFLGPPVKSTGVTYLNDVGGGNESGSRITEVSDIWPHLSSGRGT